MFQSHAPVVDDDFYDREAELARLVAAGVRLAEHSTVTWLAILGQRKVGKTSLLLEARRRVGPGVALVVMDLLERAPVDLEVFRTHALRCLDAVVGAESGRSFEVAARRGGYQALLSGVGALSRLGPDDRDLLFELPELGLDAASVARLLSVPEVLAEVCGRPVLSVWDEFQELAASSGRFGFSLLATMRSVWQKHSRVAYVISGSEPSVLRALCTHKKSPFFQHFDLMELGPMSEPDALRLVVRASEGGLPEDVARRLVGLVGGQPFYLQVLGEELLRGGPPYDDAALKDAVQRTLFSRTGRLALYLERVHGELVGRSRYGAAVLRALAPSPDGLRTTDLARAIGAPTGDTSRYVERLGDALFRDTGGRWHIRDPALALWVAWREPAGTVVPMTVVGDEAERVTALALAERGFDLVYQSRGSRGAFDLLATRGACQLGVQVKRSALPLGFDLAEWRRMEAEATRLGWAWVVAAVPNGRPVFLDPAGARIRRTARLGEDAAIPNLLTWLDARQ